MALAQRTGNIVFDVTGFHSFMVMPNHVHLLVTPQTNAREWLGPLKGYTAHEANCMLGRGGSLFWQDESYDRAVP